MCVYIKACRRLYVGRALVVMLVTRGRPCIVHPTLPTGPFPLFMPLSLSPYLSHLTLPLALPHSLLPFLPGMWHLPHLPHAFTHKSGTHFSAWSFGSINMFLCKLYFVAVQELSTFSSLSPSLSLFSPSYATCVECTHHVSLCVLNY